MTVTFYATVDSDSVRPYMPPDPVLLPASSFIGRGRWGAPRLPAHVTERAADSGGFVATFRWGDYRYTPEQYVAWLRTWEPQWAATMDYCCEPEIAANAGIVRERQHRTTEMAHTFWYEHRRERWSWVPTVQGWEVEDYARHARELRPLIEDMADYYGAGSAFRVGIGTLCRRASERMIREVVAAVSSELPNVRLHLWGVKLGFLQSPVALPDAIVSVDSAAWNSAFGYDIEKRRASGMTERAYHWLVAYPSYRAKVNSALAEPKQLALFDLCAS